MKSTQLFNLLATITGSLPLVQTATQERPPNPIVGKPDIGAIETNS